MIVLESEKPQAFGQDEMVFLSQMADRAAIALRHSQLFQELLQQQQQEQELRAMFGRFVSPEVAEAVRNGQVQLEGETRVVSILFCDIRSFTAYSEEHSPQEVVTLLNEYLPLVVNAAQTYGGTVNQFAGDSVLVIYGAPTVLQESAYRALLTALQMRNNLRHLNVRLSDRGLDPIRIGIGINTGAVVAGLIGSVERQEYTVIGDTVNLASRIEALNKQYPEHDIFISDFTYASLGHRQPEFEFVDLGDIPIRGKTSCVKVWSVKEFTARNQHIHSNSKALHDMNQEKQDTYEHTHFDCR